MSGTDGNCPKVYSQEKLSITQTPSPWRNRVRFIVHPAAKFTTAETSCAENHDLHF